MFAQNMLPAWGIKRISANAYFLFFIEGKTMENMKKRVDVRLVQSQRKLSKLTAKPTFKGFTIFDKELVGVELVYAKIKLDKPIYCGMVILDISKYAIYDVLYNKLKKRYGDNLTLLMTDTDSLLFFCETENIYADMMKDLDMYGGVGVCGASSLGLELPAFSYLLKRALCI